MCELYSFFAVLLIGRHRKEHCPNQHMHTKCICSRCCYIGVGTIEPFIGANPIAGTKLNLTMFFAGPPLEYQKYRFMY